MSSYFFVARSCISPTVSRLIVFSAVVLSSPLHQDRHFSRDFRSRKFVINDTVRQNPDFFNPTLRVENCVSGGFLSSSGGPLRSSFEDSCCSRGPFPRIERLVSCHKDFVLSDENVSGAEDFRAGAGGVGFGTAGGLELGAAKCEVPWLTKKLHFRGTLHCPEREADNFPFALATPKLVLSLSGTSGRDPLVEAGTEIQLPRLTDPLLRTAQAFNGGAASERSLSQLAQSSSFSSVKSDSWMEKARSLFGKFFGSNRSFRGVGKKAAGSLSSPSMLVGGSKNEERSSVASAAWSEVNPYPERTSGSTRGTSTGRGINQPTAAFHLWSAPCAMGEMSLVGFGGRSVGDCSYEFHMVLSREWSKYMLDFGVAACLVLLASLSCFVPFAEDSPADRLQTSFSMVLTLVASNLQRPAVLEGVSYVTLKER